MSKDVGDAEVPFFPSLKIAAAPAVDPRGMIVRGCRCDGIGDRLRRGGRCR
jgi:hypothetical protein